MPSQDLAYHSHTAKISRGFRVQPRQAQPTHLGKLITKVYLICCTFNTKLSPLLHKGSSPLLHLCLYLCREADPPDIRAWRRENKNTDTRGTKLISPPHHLTSPSYCPIYPLNSSTVLSARRPGTRARGTMPLTCISGPYTCMSSFSSWPTDLMFFRPSW